MTTKPAGSEARLEAVVALCYFGLYFAYLLVYREGELLHWVSLVALPLLALAWLRRRRGLRPSVGGILRSIGLRSGRLSKGLHWALLAGLVISGVQLLGGQGDRLLALLTSPRALYLYPLAIALMLCTAATTEEVFFRGILQSRLADVSDSETVGVLASTVFFALFHLPYAYFNPSWPSAGDWGAALRAAAANGLSGGLVLGIVFVAAGRNLLAPMLAHALINSMPGMLFLDSQL